LSGSRSEVSQLLLQNFRPISHRTNPAVEAIERRLQLSLEMFDGFLDGFWPKIMKFSGSLTKGHANRGVFITTATFTKDAVEFVEALPQKIVLMDGRQLAALMIEQDVGVSATKSYTLKRLDLDYFENL
jgi:hypothetical protein